MPELNPAIPTSEQLEQHIAEIRRLLPPDKADAAVTALTRQYDRARKSFGVPPSLPPLRK